MRGGVFLLLVLVGTAVTAEARFADTQGFSGKHGKTCESCHLSQPVDPDPPAKAILAGLPSDWTYGLSVPLVIRVEGGPPANPVVGQPQGGFDLETDRGSFAPGAGMDGLLRFPSPTEVTYTGPGTVRRSWNVVWNPPNLTEQPQEVRFWLAVVSANGNHVMGGPDTVGERGDKTDKLQASLAPSAAAQKAWLEQPLAPPLFDPYRPGATYVSGRVPDFADGCLWRLDGGQWLPATGVPFFVVQLPVLGAGPHTLEAVSTWNNRTSEPASLTVGEASVPAPSRAAAAESPAPGLLAFLLAALVLVGLVKR